MESYHQHVNSVCEKLHPRCKSCKSVCEARGPASTALQCLPDRGESAPQRHSERFAAKLGIQNGEFFHKKHIFVNASGGVFESFLRE